MFKFIKYPVHSKRLFRKQGNHIARFYANGTKPVHICPNPGSFETLDKQLPGKPIKTAEEFLTKVPHQERR